MDCIVDDNTKYDFLPEDFQYGQKRKTKIKKKKIVTTIKKILSKSEYVEYVSYFFSV